MNSINRINAIITVIILVVASSCNSITKPIEKPSEPEFVDLVYPLLDSENSRWFFFSSACRPFGMVNLSPDTEINGAWGSGYRYNTDTVKAISHIHAWQLAGLAVMPVDTKASEDIFSDYYSHFDHEKEKVFPGYHQLYLDRHKVGVELTSTKRCGFHRYTFEGNNGAILINLGGKLGPSEIVDGSLKQVGTRVLEGELSNAPTIRRPKSAKVFFRIELDSDISELSQSSDKEKFLVHLKNDVKEVNMKVGISYTSVKNAAYNLSQEIPNWDFEQVVNESRKEWNSYLGRIKVDGGTQDQQRRFYTDLWHALQGRRIISDANGYYPDNTGEHFQVKQLPLNSEGKPKFNHYNSDSFWGAQWTIQTLWQLVYPEIAEEFVNSLMQYYTDGGLIPRGPAGGNYTYVMTGSSSTPFIVGAYQKGLRDFDANEVYSALKKNHMSGGIMAKAGYEHKTSKGGGLDYYIKNGYVPYPILDGNFGYHQAGGGVTLEYAYQDWCLAQLAKALNKEDDYKYFTDRSGNYKNVFDPQTNWIRPKNANGDWMEPFDPYEYTNGFVESNAAQMTWFVPQDLDGLATLMGGQVSAVEKLNAQFQEAQKLGFTSGTAHAKETHPEYSRIPINYGNQPSIQTAFVFTHLGRPDLTQYWSRKIVQSVYEGVSTSRGYNGDEDQGLMGSLSVLMKIGLFQMTGGVEADPIYDISSPSFKRVEIALSPEYYSGDPLIIEAEGDPNNEYINMASINEAPIQSFQLRHSEITKGGTLKLVRSEVYR
ncbi:GH92 family glycosyl hydrolase [Chondrinema litorale]|uniref:GH92 family glycosyl hydrolase n=1 Tax=Chondrinema litorale TaxID=2994555 RepID=UPI002543BB72|nr:GH92 family glycosyl hydrolase [Chondrinema litorale]UZR98477.1 GH92 family glycosyl hydrolase [Chondrinema litorale]